jgi:hypothetical protein
MLASSSVGRALRCYRRRRRFESCLASHFSTWRDGREAQGSGLLNRMGKTVPRGFDSHSLHQMRTHSSAGERRSYKAEVLGSIPSACTTHATLAQLDQSAGLRSRRSKVRLLHVAPRTSSMNHAALAQRNRVPGFDPGGRGFKSCTPHQLRRAPFAIVAVSSVGSHSGLVALPRKQMVGHDTKVRRNRMERFRTAIAGANACRPWMVRRNPSPTAEFLALIV